MSSFFICILFIFQTSQIKFQQSIHGLECSRFFRSAPGQIYPVHLSRAMPQRYWCVTSDASASTRKFCPITQRLLIKSNTSWESGNMSHVCGRIWKLEPFPSLLLSHPTQSSHNPCHHDHRRYQSKSIASQHSSPPMVPFKRYPAKTNQKSPKVAEAQPWQVPPIRGRQVLYKNILILQTRWSVRRAVPEICRKNNTYWTCEWSGKGSAGNGLGGD